MVKLVIKKLIQNILGKLTVIGRVYRGNWIASSSSASGTHLTQTLTLPAGTYILLSHTPVISGSDGALLVSLSALSPPYRLVAGQDIFLTAATFTTQTDVYLQSSASFPVTFSYLERGAIIAIRIA